MDTQMEDAGNLATEDELQAVQTIDATQRGWMRALAWDGERHPDGSGEMGEQHETNHIVTAPSGEYDGDEPVADCYHGDIAAALVTLRTVAPKLAREVVARRAMSTPAIEVTTGYTRKQLAAAVDEAHEHLHAWQLAEQADDEPSAHGHALAAHEALHKAGAGQERIACATPDPEAQAMARDLRAMLDREIPCGHTIADLIYGGPDLDGRPAVTQCGQCLQDRKAWKDAQPRTPEVVLRVMLRAYEQATFDACLAYFRADNATAEERGANQQARLLHRQCDVIRREAAGVAAGYPDPVDFDVPGEQPAGSDQLMADYHARLAGTRPLNAPPAEV